MGQGCVSSGLLTADALVHSGRCKLVSVHAYNAHATDVSTIIVYDNTAASGKVVAKMLLQPANVGTQVPVTQTALSFEFDMHSVICTKGLYVDVTGGTPNLTVEFS